MSGTDPLLAPTPEAEHQMSCPAVLIEVDFEADSATRLGVADRHQH